mgnify:CR=1 FL=1
MEKIIEKYADYYEIFKQNPTVHLCSSEERGGYLNRFTRLKANKENKSNEIKK